MQCKFLNFAKFEVNQKIWKTIQGQRVSLSTRPACTVLTRPAGTAPGAAHGTGDGARPTANPALARPT
jgi:hypothetical protein